MVISSWLVCWLLLLRGQVDCFHSAQSFLALLKQGRPTPSTMHNFRADERQGRTESSHLVRIVLPGAPPWLVVLDALIAGYPVEPHPLPLCDETLQAAQDGGDKAHVLAGMVLLKDLQPCSGVSVQHHSGLLMVLGVLKGQLDGHQLCLQCGAVVRCPGKQLRAGGLPLSGSTKPSV